MAITATEFAQRRKNLLKKIPADSIVIVCAAPEYKRNADTEFLYRQQSDFYYLTGLTEPEAIAVLAPNRTEGEFILFNRARDPAAETWTGRRLGQTGAVEHLKANEAYVITDIEKHIFALLQNRSRIYCPLGYQKTFDEKIIQWMETARNKARGKITPLQLLDVAPLIAEQRLIKSQAEIDIMRKSAEISAHAHKRAMQLCKPNMLEYALEAEYRYEFAKHGSISPAYPCIVGGGANACILHYVENNMPLQSGELVLVDAGAEYQYYAADITRTFPVNGKFTKQQKAIYELVLRAQLAGIDEIKVGNTWDKMHIIIVQILTQGLVELGLLKGDVNKLINEDAYQKFYMHKSGHWLGMDVHDAGAYYDDKGHPRKLEAGMVITVEPGIYIPAHTEGVDSQWWDIGVRIEDDILVTAQGPDILSKDAPKTVADIEATMAKAYEQV